MNNKYKLIIGIEILLIISFFVARFVFSHSLDAIPTSNSSTSFIALIMSTIFSMGMFSLVNFGGPIVSIIGLIYLFKKPKDALQSAQNSKTLLAIFTILTIIISAISIYIDYLK